MENKQPKPTINPALPLQEMQFSGHTLSFMNNLPGMAYRCLCDRDWTMLFLSQGCEEITGFSDKDLLAKGTFAFTTLIDPQDRDQVFKIITEAVKQNRQYQLEYRILHRDGSTHWVWEQGNAIYDDQGEPLYLDGYIVDITSRKQMEQEMKNAANHLVELNATKDKFFSLVAHDLQNPVYAIISLSEFLESNLDSFSPRELLSFINQINVSAKGIYSLLENLLDWARSQTGKITIQRDYVSLPRLIHFLIDYFRPTAQEKKIEILFNFEEELMVESDSRLLTSILRNLISNAIKYSYPSSRVTVHMTANEELIEISVSDRGTGISRRNLERIFRIDNELRALGTNHEEGSGLGLILVKTFADLLGGDVAAVSKLNQGSTFSLYLPNRKPLDWVDRPN